MKPAIKRLARDELRIIQIAWIAQTTELLAAGLHGHTATDVDAAIERAVDLYVNRDQQRASAVVQGVQHAKDRIMHREALMLCAVVMINFYIYG
jgi:hypothetical protein